MRRIIVHAHAQEVVSADPRRMIAQKPLGNKRQPAAAFAVCAATEGAPNV
jgi:hypothetical protein